MLTIQSTITIQIECHLFSIMLKISAHPLLKLAIFYACVVAQVSAQTPMPVSVNEIKAAYLIHLSEFTDWPDEKMQLPFFSICLAADSPLRASLERMVSQVVKNKPLVLHTINPSISKETCHILYVDEMNTDDFAQQISHLDSVLTVSSEADFLKQGGIIQYYLDKNTVKMQVNLKTLNSSKLTISSKLLRLMNPFP